MFYSFGSVRWASLTQNRVGRVFPMVNERLLIDVSLFRTPIAHAANPNYSIRRFVDELISGSAFREFIDDRTLKCGRNTTSCRWESNSFESDRRLCRHSSFHLHQCLFVHAHTSAMIKKLWLKCPLRSYSLCAPSAFSYICERLKCGRTSISALAKKDMIRPTIFCEHSKNAEESWKAETLHSIAAANLLPELPTKRCHDRPFWLVFFSRISFRHNNSVVFVSVMWIFSRVRRIHNSFLVNFCSVSLQTSADHW